MIGSLKSKYNVLLNRSKAIVAEFTLFYKELYTSSNPSSTEVTDFLEATSFKT